jgi:predicted enzyme related to lactoylglutathione lyase
LNHEKHGNHHDPGEGSAKSQRILHSARIRAHRGSTHGGTTISLATFQGIIFDTDDIEKEAGELKAKGIEVGNIDDTPWGKFAWLKDLDGNGLCLHQK